MKLLVIVDMQNDFITGSLANKDAEAIIPGICDLIKEWDGKIICTQDTHDEDYLETQEGRNLKVPHCIYQTEGWLVNKDIRAALVGKKPEYVEKNTFGSTYLAQKPMFMTPIDSCEEVVFVGTCTDICVISNVLTFKATNPELPITVYGNLCAGLTKEKHEAALDVMRSCQVNVVDYHSKVGK